MCDAQSAQPRSRRLVSRGHPSCPREIRLAGCLGCGSRLKSEGKRPGRPREQGHRRRAFEPRQQPAAQAPGQGRRSECKAPSWSAEMSDARFNRGSARPCFMGTARSAAICTLGGQKHRPALKAASRCRPPPLWYCRHLQMRRPPAAHAAPHGSIPLFSLGNARCMRCFLRASWLADR